MNKNKQHNSHVLAREKYLILRAHMKEWLRSKRKGYCYITKKHYY